jgi:hypothetical protein
MMADASTATSGAGYSGTPLPKKLGLKDGQRVLFVGLPGALGSLSASAAFADVDQAKDWDALASADSGYDVVHGFTAERADLERWLGPLQRMIEPDGTIWISWPKRASRVPTDVTEDVVRDLALELDLVDVKVAAVDDVWSGLKLVIRKDRRADYRS